MHSPTTSPGAEQRTDAAASIERHATALRALEQALPAQAYSAAALADYHTACRRYEALIAATGNDDRHRFMVIIPTADRPRQLHDCLDSLLELCRIFEYGGRADDADRQGRFRKVSAMIADDSKAAASIQRHRELARQFTGLGLETRYFGCEEQIAELARLPDALRNRLDPLLGHPDRGAFHHKGHSVMRNLVYLYLHARYAGDRRQLFYFADSDQEFKVKVGDAGGNGVRDVYALNYFHHLDRHFRANDIEILTGKVVGDPPVSPAVMASNFLEDVRAFLQAADGLALAAPCPFHAQALPQDDGAAYHDMAELFGFKAGTAAYAYRCNLHGAHTAAACLDDFTQKLSRFFDGEHPTRSTYYDAQDAVYQGGPDIRPARTVYTGNYVIRADALRHCVPFAPLKLRMSGPTFGRLLQSEIGARFVSANLPMLHKRTQPDTGGSEFRPGVVKRAQHIDLSNEFERQFFGDVMLFSIEKLIGMGYPLHTLADTVIADILTETAAQMAQLYRRKQDRILDNLDALQQLHHALSARYTETPEAWARLAAFLDNMRHNFGTHAEGYRLIADMEHRQRRHAQLLAAIANYRQDRSIWDAALHACGSGPTDA